ncbi:copper-translocating P-type ATPase [Rhinocladiella mackenziei CBS 650.93]|uniref:Copper-translocating P-type ATPase n=1 Tax=Rhinocladiella mackenziei CBS 650.93 TaxID=1442369 RepID=A0A0D2ILF2_9EURO|nr:copper-translocating P-type ATPase [Rhinocladiella mackenziei CBS 650.93]KIX06534.1 copper-translocating P-type ATPase [Rhinocladiella mackenziei CBS 650.93]
MAVQHATVRPSPIIERRSRPLTGTSLDICIRAIAAEECRRICGAIHEQPAANVDDCTEPCCVDKEETSGTGPRILDTYYTKDKGHHCGASDSGGNSPKEADCCTDKKIACKSVEKDTCCADKKGDVCVDNKDDYCPEKKSTCDAKDKEYCSDKKASCVDVPYHTCCSGKQATLRGHVKNDCYTTKEAIPNTSQDDDCCADKKATCSNAPQKPNSTPSIAGKKRPRTDGACGSHLQRAFNQYASYLETGRCICQSVLNRLDGCCGNPAVKQPTTAGSTKSYGYSTSIATQSMSSLRSTTKKSCREPCCDAKISRVEARRSSDLSSCSRDRVQISSAAPLKLPLPRAKVVDIEADAAREHVILGVSGMTCTGCVRKVTNVLNNVDGVSAIKVTFVTGMAEFDLDPKVGNLPQIIPRIEKETGFKFSQIASDYQTLEVVVDPSAAQHVLGRLRDVCESVEKVNKTTYRVSHDPTAIGARFILSSVPGVRLAPPGNDAKRADGRRKLMRTAWSTSLAAVFTIPVVVLAWSDNPLPDTTNSIIELVLATVVQAIAVPEFYAGAIKSLVYSRVLEMDMLVVISITAAFGYSVVAFALTHAGYTLEEGPFFETSALLITLVLLGRLIAALAKVRAVSAVSMRSLQAEKALLVDPSSGNTTEIDARLLQLGDVFLVPPHGKIVTDGDILRGSSAVDESMLTGESLPVPKSPGDQLIAGTINGAGALTVRLTRLPGKNSITDIAGLVENALGSKPRIQDLADKIASYFIPAVITTSLIVFAVWMAVARKVRGEEGGGAMGLAITYGIAVMAVSCPCAVGLAVPMVLVIAGGVAARHGVIIKQADAIERGYKVTDVIFDKTGTITTGDLATIHRQAFPGEGRSEDEIFSVTRAITKDNQHPVSLAVSIELQKRHIRSAEVENLESVPGAGIRCTWKGQKVLAGNPFWLGIDHRPEISGLINQGMTLLCVTIESKPVAVFGLRSTIRKEATKTIADLQRRGLVCHIVSGDTPRVVEDIAQAVGVPFSKIASRQSPTDKQNYVQGLMSAKKVVLFCGDGTNDAVAVAQADVGLQIGAASDVTRATADVVLLGGLDGLLVLLNLSQRSFRRIAFNFAWSAFYNVLAMLLAAGAFVKVRIPPAYAGLGEVVSVVPVIAAAVTLMRARHAH